MYAYVMRPDTIPASYNRFIVRTGPIAELVLQAVRENARGRPINLTSIVEYMKTNAARSKVDILLLDNPTPAILGCNVLHPMEPSCVRNQFRVFKQSWDRILPVYSTLTLVSTVAFQLRRLLRSPVNVVATSLAGMVRSTLFLTWFVTSYQGAICVMRQFVRNEHRFQYFVAGLVASLAILIEKKSRRSELALYVLPRAMESLYLLLLDRGFVPHVPFGEVLLFASSVSGLMFFYDHRADRIAPMLHWAMKKLFHDPARLH
jgi:hypothetical protein